jgi:hypothetical protein
MHREPIPSSIILSAGYDEDEALLEIQFANGDIHQYLDVPREKFDALMNTDFHESYFNHNIRGMYEYQQIAVGLSHSTTNTFK